MNITGTKDNLVLILNAKDLKSLKRSTVPSSFQVKLKNGDKEETMSLTVMNEWTFARLKYQREQQLKQAKKDTPSNPEQPTDKA